MDSTVSFTVNGQPRTVTTDPHRPLLDVLREDLKLTGTKYGCGEGQCRACTVLMNGKSVASCVTRVGDADKQEILTIEGQGIERDSHESCVYSIHHAGWREDRKRDASIGVKNEIHNPSHVLSLGVLNRCPSHLAKRVGMVRRFCAYHGLGV